MKIEKLKEMIMTIIREHNGKISRERLAALLYLSDFTSYYHRLKSISGTKYTKK